jgi:hypothetical protein
MRDEIRAKSEMRTNFSAAANAAWQKQVQIHDRFVPDDVKQRFDKIIDYNNEQLQKELVPLYRKMLELYLNNKWLADPRCDPVAIVEVYLEPFGIWQVGQSRAHVVPSILKGSIGD